MRPHAKNRRAIFGHWLSPLCLFHQQHSGASNDLSQQPNCGLDSTLLERNNILEYREIIESYWRTIYKIEGNQVVMYALIDGRRNVEEILIKRLSAKP
jgi:toxin ParE1/3/4